MGNKRLFNDSGELNGALELGSRKRLKEADCPAFGQPGGEETPNEPAANEVNSVVKDLVTELVNTTTESEQLDLSGTSLDESFRLNYDFSLVANPTDLSTDQRVDEPQATTAYGGARFDTSFTEHNYANNCSSVPSTSCAASSSTSTSSNQSSHPHSGKPVKGALRFHNAMKSTNKKNVKFKGVTVFYFSRNQGGSTVPSQGGSTLGMGMNHCDSKNFTLDAHQEEKRQVHREILLRQKRYEKMYQKQQARTANAAQSDSDEDSLGNISDISDSELEFDSWYFLQPVPVKQRRALLRESGVNKIDSAEKEECRDIRQSREFCGCDCRVYCDESTCQCSLAGIKCQVDRLHFPCGCARDSCGNVNGRIEFNPIRVRTHFIHTIMRLELDKKNENQQQYLNETTTTSSMLNPVVDHPYHLKANPSSIELMNQNSASLFPPLSASSSSTVTSAQLDSPYELKFIQSNDSIYGPLDSNPLATPNILSCNEVSNLIGNDYDGFGYEDSGDSGSSSYSESSDCTSEELDCRLTTAADNQTLNGLSAFNLSPFSLISSVPTTNAGDPTTAGYDAGNQAAYSSNHFLTDQSFRYYSPLPGTGSPATVPQLDQTNATNGDQLMGNHLHYLNYYPDTLYISNNSLVTGSPAALAGDYDAVSSSITGHSNSTTISSSLPNPTNPELSSSPSTCKPMTNNDPLTSLTGFSSGGGVETGLLPSFETHYTDLSQSIASKSAESILSAANVCPVLLSTDSSTVLDQCEFIEQSEFDVVVEQLAGEDGRLGNSSCSEDSSSGQSLQNELCEEPEDNFGEIIKNATIGVESVTA